MKEISYTQIQENIKDALTELINTSKLEAGDIIVIGCSSSEVAGERIGSFSSEEIGLTIFKAAYNITKSKGLYLACQCCEHLNRALIIEKECAKHYNYSQVNVIPQLKAGGSFATAAYKNMEHPVAVEHISADAGLDIGDTLIGMHLKDVAVPVRLTISSIGNAHLVAARTRAKFIGGIRACYNDELL